MILTCQKCESEWDYLDWDPLAHNMIACGCGYCGTPKELMDKEFTKHDAGKPRMTLVPTILRKAVATIMTFGANKYGIDNWKECKAEELWRYKDAMERHWCAYLEGEWLDPESNKPHLWHAATNMGMLIWHEDKNRSTSSSDS